MPVVLRIDGYKFHFYANEGDPREPVHCHVRHGRDEAKFWLSPDVGLAYNRGLTSRQLSEVQHLVEQHREFLIGAWDDFFS
jgi:Domain of unknown function (DUF4160)